MDKLDLKKSNQMYEHAKELVPGGVSCIRRPYNFVLGEYPVFFESAKGSKVTDVDGNEYIDMLCDYGHIIIGHREEEIDNAVIEQIRTKGFCMSLTQAAENKLAEKLRESIPCCEKCVFVETGYDATAAAIEIALGYTDKPKILRCAYDSRQDWCVKVKSAIPRKFCEDVLEFKYNDLDQAEDLLKKYGSDAAAIVATPIGHPMSRKLQMPKPGFLEGLRRLADKYECALIFDETKTGFRVNLGGAQKEYNVTPDLAVFGKTMANGYPISAVVGKKQIMDAVIDKVFLSSDFFPNSLAQIAALKTIEIMERDDVLDVIKQKSERFARKISAIVKKSKVPCTFTGAPGMFFITFDKDEKKLRTEFYTQLIRRRIFQHPYHHGYIAYRHTDKDLNRAIDMIGESLDEVKKIL